MEAVRLCSIDGCEGVHEGKGYCKKHYLRQYRYGSVDVVKQLPNYAHNMTNTTEWRAWVNMLKRCYDPTNSHYKHYGGRGIAVSDEWRNDSRQFLIDMGAKPSPEHSLERVDNDKGYSKENCKWATRSEQAINQRLRHDNKSGYKGVTFTKANGKWQAYIKMEGKMKHLGFYVDKEEAIKARQEAERQRAISKGFTL